ncbi:hypothetical protein GCM10008986_24830 [Salinibacillus aidingensis]|uniref:AAA+ ATPase domain-containing protein n=1 Tax=Salinibacillus aidingensis TaxID=237684 RepID=A0ABN1BFL8_9BACI
MYKSYYSLAQEPFTKEANTSEAFTSSPYQEALARLDYLQKARGMGLIVGEPGAGKTFALRSFQESLNPSLYHVVYFPLSTGGVMDFYRGIAYGLGEEPNFRKVDLFRQIQSGIERMYKGRNITPVFILDEMHMAKDAFLNDLSVLFNFHMDAFNPFILVLAGLPHLRMRLGLNQNRPLAQRLIMRYQMEALNKDEVSEYVAHHLKAAGAKMPIFTEPALEAIALHSQGWPRLINTLATNSLLLGYQMKKENIDEEVVRLAAEESGL